MTSRVCHPPRTNHVWEGGVDKRLNIQQCWVFWGERSHKHLYLELWSTAFLSWGFCHQPTFIWAVYVKTISGYKTNDKDFRLRGTFWNMPVGYGGLVAWLVCKKNDEDDSYTITVPTCWQVTVRQGLFLIDTVHPVFLVWDYLTLVFTRTPPLKNSPTWFCTCHPFYPLSFLTYCIYLLTYLLPSFLCSFLLLETESVCVTFFPLCSVAPWDKNHIILCIRLGVNQ